MYEIWHCIHVLSNSWYCKIYNFFKYGTSVLAHCAFNLHFFDIKEVEYILTTIHISSVKVQEFFIFFSPALPLSLFPLSFSLPPSLSLSLPPSFSFSFPSFLSQFAEIILVCIAVLFWLHELHYFLPVVTYLLAIFMVFFDGCCLVTKSYLFCNTMEGFPGCVSGKEPACQCRRHKRCGVQSLSLEDPLEESMATHFSILAWRIPRTEQPGRVLSTGSELDTTKVT